jgi:hypothetical protein
VVEVVAGAVVVELVIVLAEVGDVEVLVLVIVLVVALVEVVVAGVLVVVVVVWLWQSLRASWPTVVAPCLRLPTRV